MVHAVTSTFINKNMHLLFSLDYMAHTYMDQWEMNLIIFS